MVLARTVHSVSSCLYLELCRGTSGMSGAGGKTSKDLLACTRATSCKKCEIGPDGVGIPVACFA